MIDLVLVEILRCICSNLAALCKVCRSRKQGASVESSILPLEHYGAPECQHLFELSCTMKRKDLTRERVDNHITEYLRHLPVDFIRRFCHKLKHQAEKISNDFLRTMI